MQFLVVDDSKMARFLVVKLLKELGHTDILVATSVEEAKTHLLSYLPDCILSDWHMNGETGFDLLLFVRSNPKTVKVPFIMITTEQDKANIIKSIKHGAQAYILKPITKKTLEEKISQIFKPLEVK